MLAPIRRFWRSRFLPNAPEGQRWVLFDDGRVAFLAPANYSMHREEDNTVAIYPPGEQSGVTLRFSLHTHPLDPRLPPDVAEKFVTAHASEHSLPITRLPDRMFLTETRENDWPDRHVLMHFWQIATGRILVVASATIWGADRETDTIRRAIAAVPQIIQSFRLT